MMIDLLKKLKRPLWAVLVAVCFSAALIAQTSRISVRGQVTDPSGAAIPAATVTITGPSHMLKVAQTDEQGRYVFRDLPLGTYTIKINTTGFATFTKTGIHLTAGHFEVVNAQMALTIEKQQVTVQSESERLSVNPENNVGALVLKGAALKSLSDDPDELQSELQQLAGPAAGPNGGQIYIDGFSGGQLPPKEAILEVRVNQNPFSAQYERLGYGRIDIITKPGFSKYHGHVFGFGNDSSFNSRNPFVTNQPGYYSDFIAGNFGGPLGKKASFFFDLFRRSTNSTSIVNAQVLDPTFNSTEGVPF
ncbi:MAG: carboxypeptidase regulatory-like domain-containing protein, partial [Acidobacteriota bacterium]